MKKLILNTKTKHIIIIQLHINENYTISQKSQLVHKT